MFPWGVQLRFASSVSGIEPPGFKSVGAHTRERRRSFANM